MSTLACDAARDWAVQVWLCAPGTDVLGDIDDWVRAYCDSGQAAHDHAAILAEHRARLAACPCNGWGEGRTVWQEPVREW